MPLKMHKFAVKAALAALAAAKQGKYSEISKVFLKNYKKLNNETIIKYAEETGLDMQNFNKDYNDPSLKKIVGQDIALGKQVKVRGVPALFINGRPVKMRSLSALSQMVEQELKEKTSM
jgi:protein-disulfide isomerase